MRSIAVLISSNFPARVPLSSGGFCFCFMLTVCWGAGRFNSQCPRADVAAQRFRGWCVGRTCGSVWEENSLCGAFKYFLLSKGVLLSACAAFAGGIADLQLALCRDPCS